MKQHLWWNEKIEVCGSCFLMYSSSVNCPVSHLIINESPNSRRTFPSQVGCPIATPDATTKPYMHWTLQALLNTKMKVTVEPFSNEINWCPNGGG